ncbi:EscU/YscU/HrcU family type III secretion system export apparatus switch protein [Burkholderia sp. BCC1977]|uniref:EscU/YscU/HrcU family type III secretion system export apparatus switch protein n=1 Tax=Burkholderia sp. BCC1977 TaxID=2817440 RepID=UPI002ABE534A|nr:EscU/YscU/HrcU family type III secretion system export apparatus switch protein [Burkholderia sp. BCC1977]
MSDIEQNKSEQATAYKLEQARKKGMIPRSPELGMVVSLVACSLYLSAWGGDLAARLATRFARAFSVAGTVGANTGTLKHEAAALILDSARAIAPLIGVAAGGALVATLAQTGLLFAPKALKADWSKLNPVQGIKRLMSIQMLIDALKACVKMIVYTAIAYYTIRDTVVSAAHATASVSDLAGALLHETLRLIGHLLAAAIVFAAIDQILVRRAFARKMRMSRYEQKQEIKQREGDPRIRQRRKQLQRELLQRAQSMRNVRGADVLVTNPTHYAIGLRYDATEMTAPQVVAKGSGEFARRLKKLAFIYGVPVIESRQLARELHRYGTVEREVPGAMYRDVASVYLKIRRHPARAEQRA